MGLGVRAAAGAGVPALGVPAGGEGWGLTLRGSGDTAGLCTGLCAARGVSAAFPCLCWRFLHVRELREFPDWESLLDSSIPLTGPGDIGLGLEHAESSWEHCGSAPGTGGSGMVTGASAKGAEKKQSHLPVCSSRTPPTPGAPPVPPSSVQICPPSPPAALCQRLFHQSAFNPEEKSRRGGRAGPTAGAPGQCLRCPRQMGSAEPQLRSQDRAVARRIRRKSSALLRAGCRLRGSTAAGSGKGSREE